MSRTHRPAAPLLLVTALCGFHALTPDFSCTLSRTWPCSRARPFPPAQRQLRRLQRPAAESSAQAGPEPHKALKILLLGRTGAGKSTTGNLLCHEELFETKRASLASVTTTAQCESRSFKDLALTVLDLPGFAHTNVSWEALMLEVERIPRLLPDGIDAILLQVAGLDRYTPETARGIQQLEQITRSSEAWKHVILVLKDGDRVTKEQFLEAAGEVAPLAELLNRTSHRVVAADTSSSLAKERTRTELLSSIQSLVEENKGATFSSAAFKEARKVQVQELTQGNATSTFNDLGQSVSRAFQSFLDVAGQLLFTTFSAFGSALGQALGYGTAVLLVVVAWQALRTSLLPPSQICISASSEPGQAQNFRAVASHAVLVDGKVFTLPPCTDGSPQSLPQTDL